MKSKKRITISFLFLTLFTLLLSGCQSEIAVLNPQGPVAQKQYDLIVFSFWVVMGIFVVVMGLFTYMLLKYRATPKNEGYIPPDIHGSTKLEIIWTAIPVVIITILCIPTVKTLFELEEIPKGYEKVKPITINVTSAEWKWIFSYPEQNIETVNYVNIPEDTPVKFQLTSTGTMSSFWVPELGGQKYTMPGHDMELILLAENPGSYIGRNANFNGEDFTHMDFEVVSQTKEEFQEWVEEVKQIEPQIKKSDYEQILEHGLVGRMTFNGTHLPWSNLKSTLPSDEKMENTEESKEQQEHSHHH